MEDRVIVSESRLYRNSFISSGGTLSERSVAWLLWSIGAGIYVQGHGIHLAAAMFKVKERENWWMKCPLTHK